ncbi:hypothetical protein TNCT_21031, partial [Trichonephila clavata]
AMPFSQFPKNFLQPPTTEIVGSCYRINQLWLLKKSGSLTFSLPKELARNGKRHNQI